MVEFIEDTDSQTCICKSDKMVTDIHIKKSIGSYNGFVVSLEKGTVPAELSGKYSTITQAKKAVESYLRNKKETVAARRSNFQKELAERKAKNGSKDRTEDS
jgi:rRNA processing protein Krr1/Pno1